MKMKLEVEAMARVVFREGDGRIIQIVPLAAGAPVEGVTEGIMAGETVGISAADEALASYNLLVLTEDGETYAIRWGGEK